MTTTDDTVVADLIARLDSLQAWFASRPYGFREQATAGQLQQWADREREQDALVARLARIGRQ